jgi:protoporphyrinogen oxidase
VIVIGGGPTGLSAAHALASANVPVLVLEAEPQLGGLAGSFDFEGFRVDYGPHRLHQAASPRVLGLYASALGGALLERRRNGRVHVDGGVLPYPLSLLGIARGLGLRRVLQHGASAVYARLVPPEGAHFGAEAARRLGRRAARVLYGPAARKVWGLAPEALDPKLGRARVEKRGPWAVVRAALGWGKKASAGRRYFYPREGFGQLSDGLAEQIRRRGGEVRLGVRVAGLCVERGRVVGVRTDDGAELRARAVIATSPLTSLCEWVGATDAAEGLDYRALVLVYLSLARARLSGQDVHYFADEAIAPNRLFEAANFLARPEEEAENTVVGFDLPCTVGDATWSASDDELARKVSAAVAKVSGGTVPSVEAVTSRRRAHAYPLYRRGHAERRSRALAALAKLEGLYPVGRQALFVHDNVHHACEAGLAAGDAVARGWSTVEWHASLGPLLETQIED